MTQKKAMAKAPAEHDFTKGPILGPLVRFMLPVLAALFLQSLYGAVDLLVVGRFATSGDVSGVSTGAQLMMTITNVVANFAMGATIMLGQKLGQGRSDECGRIIGSGIRLFTIIGLVLTVIVFAGAPLLATALSVPEEAYSMAVDYIRICGAGIIVITAYNLIGSIFRGIGDSNTPLITVAIACVCNIFGDLLLVAVFHMGAAGAALATVGAQLVSVVASLFIIARRGMPFPFSKKDLSGRAEDIRRIVSLGLPLVVSALLVDLSFLVILKIINSLGIQISAGVGVAEKVCAFIMLVSVAFMQSMASFVSQNFGAGLYDRAKMALKCGIGLSLACGIVIGAFTFFRGDLLVGIFTEDTELIKIGAEYLKAYAIDTVLTAFLFCFTGFFNGVGMTRFVMIQGIVSALGIRVPVSYIMSRQVPVSVFKIGLATPCSTVVQIILCFIALRWFTKKYGRSNS